MGKLNAADMLIDLPLFWLTFVLQLQIMELLAFLNPVFLLSLPGGNEWILIILVVLLFFGGKKIPELMRGLGRGIREFNDAKSNVKKEIEEGMNEKDGTRWSFNIHRFLK